MYKKNKLIAIVSCLVLALSVLVACQPVDPDTQPSAPIVVESPTSPDATQSPDATPDVDVDGGSLINYNFEFFEATNSVYGNGSLIDAFPLLNTEDTFWRQTEFVIYTHDGVKLDPLAEDSPYCMAWDDAKAVTVDKINMLAVGNSDGPIPPMDFKFLNKDESRTLGEVIESRDWHTFCYADTQKQIDEFFPKKADSIAETIVANYGQPSDVSIEGDMCQVEYHINNRNVVFKIGKNTDVGQLLHT